AAVDRGNIDNASPAAIQHGAEQGLGHVEHRVQVSPQDGLPVLPAQVFKRGITGDPRIINQNINLCAVCLQLLCAVQAGLGISHIDLVEFKVIAGLGLFGQPLLGLGDLGVFTNEYTVATIVQPAGDGGTQAA